MLDKMPGTSGRTRGKRDIDRCFFFLLHTRLEVFSVSEFGIKKSGFEHHLSTPA